MKNFFSSLLIFILVLPPLHQAEAREDWWKQAIWYVQSDDVQALDEKRLNDYGKRLTAPSRNVQKVGFYTLSDETISLQLTSGQIRMPLADIREVMKGVLFPVNETAKNYGLTASDVAEILYLFDFNSYVRNELIFVHDAILEYEKMQASDGIHSTKEIFTQFYVAMLVYHLIKKQGAMNTEQRNASFDGAQSYMVTVLAGLLNKIAVSEFSTEDTGVAIARNVRQGLEDPTRAVFKSENRKSLTNAFMAYLQVTEQKLSDGAAWEVFEAELALGVNEIVRSAYESSFSRSVGAWNAGTYSVLATATLGGVILPAVIGVDSDTFFFSTVLSVIGGAMAALYAAGTGVVRNQNRIRNQYLALQKKVLQRLFMLPQVTPCEAALER